MAVCARCKGTGFCRSCGGHKPCHCPLGKVKTREQIASRSKDNSRGMTAARAGLTPRASGKGPVVNSFIKPKLK